MRVNIIGIGMGTADTMTLEAKRALEQSDLIIGAKRLLEALPESTAEKRALIKASEIEQAVRESKAELVSVAVSGGVGFYSMATSLCKRLSDLDVRCLPGISSVNYFFAKLHMPWQDAYLASAHGRDCNVVGIVRTHAKTFLLTGGAIKAHDVCSMLTKAHLGFVTVHAGENLGYKNERLVSGSAAELAEMEFADLSVLVVENPRPLSSPYLIPSIPDEEFIRGKVPMTKQEVRSLALAKLQLKADSVVWDVGAGTGSISMECALVAREGAVYAIERKPEALSLIAQNAERFNCGNIFIVEGEAPEALHDLPAPDCVFVGGSGGHLEQILQIALAANPTVRIVIAAIALETIGEATRLLDVFNLADPETVQVSISRGHKAGNYTLMQACNPIYLISGRGRG